MRNANGDAEEQQETCGKCTLLKNLLRAPRRLALGVFAEPAAGGIVHILVGGGKLSLIVAAALEIPMRGKFFHFAAHHGDRVAVGFEIRLAAIVKRGSQRIIFIDQGVQQLISRAAFFGIERDTEDLIVVGEVA